jgi:hypothetical protein
MNSIPTAENTAVDTEIETPKRGRRPGVRRGPGRPRKVDLVENGADVTPIGLKKSQIAYRKWQRSVVKPQFALSRQDAVDLLFKHLRSRAGKSALKAIVMKGFAGIGKLKDQDLAKYLEESALLSRYPHTVVIAK